MSLPVALSLFVILQGTYSLVLLGIMILYALFFWKKQKGHRYKIVVLGLSHFLLICGTSCTLYLGLYPMGHWWYFMVFSGYTLSDIILLRLWIDVIKLNRTP